MKNFKKNLALLSALALAGTMLAGCGDKTTDDTATTTAAAGGDAATTAAADTATDDGAAATTNDPAKAGTGITLSETEGKVFNIYAWNEEFKGFFEKYYTVPEGVTVSWTINPSNDGVYQQKLDEALSGQDAAAADYKIDMFLAEADYIAKYTNAAVTMDVTTIGVKPLDTEYDYTISAASGSDGALKGVSFQCCPSALIYRRSIAEAVLGTSDPAEVQAQLSDWTKFDEVAAKAKEAGYLMTPSYAETYRPFANNITTDWVSADGVFQVDDQVKAWIKQAKNYVDNGYTTIGAVWSDEKTAQMGADGKAMCFFGPAWYYNFCMETAKNEANGDWAIVEGPAAHFWGGTWLLAATGTDNPEMVADVMNAFTANEDICSKLVSEENQFSNNTAVNQKFADDPNYGNEFLGGQNDTAVFVELAKNIKFRSTPYGQVFNEDVPGCFLDYFTGKITEAEAWANVDK
ncbi:MAG: carbohydrate ABC transporter substrate-binding protein, partial [Oscillospiraceae bacterium]